MDSYIDKAIEVLNRIEGFPAAALVFLTCIAIGYIIRAIPQIPNGAIPAVIILWGGFFMGLIANSRDNSMSLRVWIVRNAAVGISIGLIAWLTHRFAISYLEDWIQGKLAKRFPENILPPSVKTEDKQNKP